MSPNMKSKALVYYILITIILMNYANQWSLLIISYRSVKTGGLKQNLDCTEEKGIILLTDYLCFVIGHLKTRLRNKQISLCYVPQYLKD